MKLPKISADNKRVCLAVTVTVLISGLLTAWSIYSLAEYGIALFILTPLFMGAGSVIIYGYKKEITASKATGVAFLTLLTFCLGILLFAMEGLICILMAAPIAGILTWIGSGLGFLIVKRSNRKSPGIMLILIAIIPLTAYVEKDSAPSLHSVTTSIVIEADAQTVWNNVIEFPLLKEPSEFIFKTGIAYPTDATIEGMGVGAIRHCNFTTGSFTEPIVVWDEPRLLMFDVLGQPAPMKEISFWDIDAPHLHDYFVSKQGQFKLTPLAGGQTLLEGTTWYYHNIKPAFYWRLWSDYIIHKIHRRVLTHIQSNAE